MLQKNTAPPTSPPRFAFEHMRRVLNDLFGTDALALLRYREALALDEQGWECTHCNKPLAPYTLCSEIGCIAVRQNARLRQMTAVC